MHSRGHYLDNPYGESTVQINLNSGPGRGSGRSDSQPGSAPLEKAYNALRAKDYDQAMAGFQQAIALAPNRASIHKDLA